ncbi:MAG: pepN [Actinomycetia bacterium]|nr:pepN [Actinomycetes bacterium]
MANNLTREEARDRRQLLDARSYQVELDFTGGDDSFLSASTVRFQCTTPGADTFIELTAPAVREIVLNGDPVSVSAFDGNRIALHGLRATNELRVVAECAYSRSGEGLHRFTDPSDGGVYLYSDLETYDAHRVYACFDQPDLKASFEFSVIAPGDWLVLSNMAAEAVGQTAPGNVKRWRFPPSPVMSTYITAMVAGPYYQVTSEHDGIPLGIYCRRSLAGYLDPEEIFEVTRQGFDFFHDAFGVRYAFGKYDQVFVPEFKAGAMENAGCVTFLEDYVFRSRVTDFARELRGDTILHEMAHMWFGDLVTMRWWDDLWLNESFATWASAVAQAEATRWHNAWTTFCQLHKAWAYQQDQLPSTHPIAADIPDIAAVEVNFDGITYAKGASVLKQLVAYVGRDHFLDGVRRYFAEHAWGNATLADLLGALQESSGRELSGWSKQWLETAGVNTLRPEYDLDGDQRITEFAVVQTAPAGHPVLRAHRIAVGLYDRTEAGLGRRRRLELDIAGERTVVDALAGERQPDLVLVNDDDLTYAKMRLDSHSLVTLITAIGEFTESLPAALCWAAAWDMCRDAEMAARHYVQLVMSGVDHAEDISVVQTLLRQATSALRRFTDPAWRPGGMNEAAGVLLGLAERAAPGSDRQLAYVQAFASLATSRSDLARLSGLLNGSAYLDGLTVDTELRWRLLHRLVSQGAAGPAEIDAELRRDPTDAGERRAATCRAAIPEPAAKEAAWQAIVSGTLPNAMFRATLNGFSDPDQADLLAPYATRYFEVVGDVWRNWSSDMAQGFATNAYPLTQISERTVELTDAYIAEADPPAALRRLLLEGRDSLQRALRCQARDRLEHAA